MPSVTAQDPARIAEGILPLLMKHGNFVISGAMWRKFNVNRRWLTFAEFWSMKERAYNRSNAQSKLFFDNFTRDEENTVRFFTIVLFIAKLDVCLITMFPIRLLLGCLSRRWSPWKSSMGIIASCTKKKVPSFKATDGRRTLLQGPGLRHIFRDWPKR